MISTVAFSAALALAWALGAHWARESERRRFARGDISRFEADLLRSKGRRMHPDPSTAAVISRAHVIRRG